MIFENRTWKKTALSFSFGIAAIVMTAMSASAHQVYTRCDSDGDRCWRVICDDDGDDCRRAPAQWDRGQYWNNRYYGRQGWGGYGYDRRANGRWVCDSDGDRCRWVRYSNAWWDH